MNKGGETRYKDIKRENEKTILQAIGAALCFVCVLYALVWMAGHAHEPPLKP